jgi:hypothetical protein
MTKASLDRVNGYGALRSVLETACEEQGCGLGGLTVLSTQVDPYRLDTAAGHGDGQWIAKQLKRALKRGALIHWRGLHYAIVAQGNVRKPDGERPLVLFTLADCDPAGRQMSVSIGRKLQAFKDLLFPNLRFEVVPVALTVEQVRELGLPSTPLKETEKRAGRWRETFGVEQTEIDALATLQPDVLRDIVEAAFDPYFDRTLATRVSEAREQWRQHAEEAIREQVDPTILANLRQDAGERLAELRSVIDDINERMRLAADDFVLPRIEVPEPEVDEDASRQALVSFNDSWLKATRALIARKQYGSAS